MINDDGSHLLIWLWSNSREYTGPGHHHPRPREADWLTDAATVFCKCSFCHCAVTRCRPRNSTFVFLRCEDAPTPLPDAPWGRELHLIWHKLCRARAAAGSGPQLTAGLCLTAAAGPAARPSQPSEGQQSHNKSLSIWFSRFSITLPKNKYFQSNFCSRNEI